MDVIVQAASGAMAKTGFRGRTAARGRASPSPTTRLRRSRRWESSPRSASAISTGVGQLVDVAMLDVLTALVFDEPVDHYAATGIPVRTGNADARGAPINAYRCADGWVAVTCTSEGQFERLCDADGAARAADAVPRRAGARGRRARARRRDRSVDGRLDPHARSKPRSSASASPRAACANRSRPPTDPAVRQPRVARGAAASRRAGRPPERLPRRARSRSCSTAGSSSRAAELLGASTDAVLRELGGCDDDELARLRADGVIA